MFAERYNVPSLLDNIEISEDQTIQCSRTFDMDYEELRRQYPDYEWNQALYGELVLNSSEPLKLKVIRFTQSDVQTMMHQTTTIITYAVDIPISEADVIRHREFALTAANRRIYNITNRRRSVSIRDATDADGLTEGEADANRNVRQRIREGPIRPPLLFNPNEDGGSGSSAQLIFYDDNVIDITSDDGEHTLVVRAIDPGTAIATEINPTFRGISISMCGKRLTVNIKTLGALTTARV
jgi:hypothetical protein